MNKASRIYVAGAGTMIGRAIAEELRGRGHTGVLPGAEGEPDLTDRRAVDAFFADHRPEVVFVAAGRSGGIGLNRKAPADLLLDNALVSAHLIDAAHRSGVRKLLYLASSCVYPRDCPQPMKPEYIMTGRFEPTNEAYATGKLAGLVLCQAYRQQHDADFIVGIPSTPFGPGDHFDPENSHVVGALIRKMHEAKIRAEPSVGIWGTGAPRRDFIFARDLASACCCVMDRYDGDEPINLGCNATATIAELADLVRQVVGFRGELIYDRSKPDGMPIKSLDAAPLRDLGWRSTTGLAEALELTYEAYLSASAPAP